MGFRVWGWGLGGPKSPEALKPPNVGWQRSFEVRAGHQLLLQTGFNGPRGTRFGDEETTYRIVLGGPVAPQPPLNHNVGTLVLGVLG